MLERKEQNNTTGANDTTRGGKNQKVVAKEGRLKDTDIGPNNIDKKGDSKTMEER